MRKLSPPSVFTIGSLVLLATTSLYYLLVPRFNYFTGEYLIYKPGNAFPESSSQEYAVSNVYLVLKFGELLILYLAAFVLVYFICSKVRRLKTTRKYVWIHLILTSLAFILLIYLNPYIILPGNIGTSAFLSDLYIDGVNVSEVNPVQANKLFLWLSSLQTPTSVVGMVLCIIGVVVFAIGTFRRTD